MRLASLVAVSGPANALYSHPMSNPLFSRTSAKFTSKSNHSKICNHIWRNQRQLRSYWLNLAFKFTREDRAYRVNAVREKAIGDAMFAIGERIRKNEPLGVAPEPAAAPLVSTPGAFGNVGFGSSLGMSASSTSRAARGARRSMDGKGGEFAGSEQEQELFLKEILKAEAFEKRIANGKMAREKIPRQVTKLERSMAGKFVDTGFTRRVDDGWAEEESWEKVNPWSDIEKAIFVDKFCQWPKNFRKIGGFLRNKSTGDCISFYYASKKFINYKLLLRGEEEGGKCCCNAGGPWRGELVESNTRISNDFSFACLNRILQ